MGQSYTSAFPATENPVSESGKWINGAATGLDWHNCRTTPGKIFGTMVNGDANFTDSLAVASGLSGWASSPQVVKAVVFSNNQISSGDAANVSEECELLLRFTITAHSATGYECLYSNDPNDPYIQIVRWDGILSNFIQIASVAGATIFGSVGAAALQTGDVLKATICGKHIAFYRNDVLCLEVDDTTYTTGAPGVGFYYKNDSAVGTYSSADFGFSQVEMTNNAWARAGCKLNTIAANPGASTWNAGNLDNTPPAGTRLIAGVMLSLSGSNFPTASKITDSAGNVWWRDAVISNNQGAYCEEYSVWSTIHAGGAVNSVTVAFSPSLASAAGAGINVVSYGGLSPAPGSGAIVDFFQFTVDTASPMDSGTSAGTTDRANELKLGFYGDAGNNSTIAISSPDANFAVLMSQVSSGITQMATADASAGAPGSTARVQWTTSTNADCLVGVVVYRSVEPNNSVRESHRRFPKPILRTDPLRKVV